MKWHISYLSAYAQVICVCVLCVLVRTVDKMHKQNKRQENDTLFHNHSKYFKYWRQAIL